MSEEYLAHHGVLGMKWGVRRYQPYGGGTYEPEHRGRFVGKNGSKNVAVKRSTARDSQREEIRKAKADKKAYEKDYKNAKKTFDRAAKKNLRGEQYAAVQEAQFKELRSSKKAQPFMTALATKSSFTLEDVANYNDEATRIGKKYAKQTEDALIKDLKLEDTKGARAFVEELVRNSYEIKEEKGVIIPHH